MTRTTGPRATRSGGWGDPRVARVIAAAAGTGLGALGVGALGAAGIGWLYSGRILDTRRVLLYPERVLGVVVDEEPGVVVLASSRLTRQRGTWGLSSADGLAVVGDVLSDDGTEVRRPLLSGPAPAAGAAVGIEPNPFDPDPSVRGLGFEEVVVDAPVGPAPAWLVPGAADGPLGADTWIVAVHGRGGRRREALRVLPALHATGATTLVTTYRNDTEAPFSDDRWDHLGDSEWLDTAAALRFALDRGARRIVLYGWSMGGAITGQVLDRAEEADAVAAVVWDAPLTDWRATLRQQARNRGLPPGFSALATAVTTRRIGIDFDRFDLAARPPARRPPTLLIHSAEDTAVPVSSSRRLVAAVADLGWPLRYVEVAGVEHTASWNADPGAYETAVTSFLVETLVGEAAGGGGRQRPVSGAGTMGS